GLFNVRRMFGGALWNAWPFALLSRRYADGFVDRLKSAVGVSEDFVRACPPDVRIERVVNGTNIFRVIVAASKADATRERLRSHGVVVPAAAKRPDSAIFTLQVNESWNRTTGARLANQFARALNS